MTGNPKLVCIMVVPLVLEVKRPPDHQPSQLDWRHIGGGASKPSDALPLLDEASSVADQ